MTTPIDLKRLDTTNAGALYLLTRMLECYSPSGEEAPMAGLLTKAMTHLGFDAHVDAAGNAIGKMGTGDRVLLLLGHMDTVRGYIPVRREGNHLHGRGSVDAKGPLATFIMAAARARLPEGLRLVVAGAVEEEAATSKGAYHLLQGPRPDYVIIGEPGGWSRIVLGYKGRLLVDYTVTRSTSHTAGPEPSAAETVVGFWNRVQKLAEQQNEGVRGIFGTLDPSLRTLNTEDNEFSQDARMTIGLRLPPGTDIPTLETQLAALATTGRASFRGAEEPFRAPKNSPLTRAFLPAIRAHEGRPAFAVKTGTSDMNVVGPRWKCPIVAYGPGDSSLDHTPREHIEIREYLRAIEVLTDVLSTPALQTSR